jgi:hypothetical protein
MSVLPLMGSHDETVENSSVRFSSHADVAWLRDRAGVFVFNSRRQKYWLLAGLEADLWDWFVLGHPLDIITARFASITKTPQETARQGVLRFVWYLVQEEIWVEAS